MTLVMMPRKIMLVMDVSSSMAGPSGEGSSKLDDAKKGAIDFITGQYLSDRDEIGLIQFSNNAETVCPLATATQDYLTNTVIPAVQGLYVQNNTALWDAIGKGLDTLHENKNGSVLILVVLTDGEDNASTRFPRGPPGCPAIFDYAKQKGINDVLVYIIGMGLLKESEDCLGKFASATGGQYYPSQTNKISKTFGRVKDDVRAGSQRLPGKPEQTGRTEEPRPNPPDEAFPFSHDDAVRAYADRLKAKGHKVRINATISKRSGKVHVDIEDKTDNTFIEIVLGIPDDKGLRELIKRLIHLNDVLKGRLRVVFVTSYGNQLPEWFKTVCQELGIEIEFMDPTEAALGLLDFSYNRDGTFNKVDFDHRMRIPPFNLIPSEEGAPCLPLLVVIPEISVKKFETSFESLDFPCFKYSKNALTTGITEFEGGVTIPNTMDRICHNLLIACNHAFRCNEKGKNKKIIVIWSRKMAETSLKHDEDIIECWTRFKEAMDKLRRQYGTILEVQIKYR